MNIRSQIRKKDGGFWIDIPNIGGSYKFGANTIEEIEKEVAESYKFARSNAYSKEEKDLVARFQRIFGFKAKTNTVKKLPTKRYTGKIAEKQLKSIWNYAINSGIVIGKTIAAAEMASIALARVRSAVKFNNWTGNLENSFCVGIILGRKLIYSQYNDSATSGEYSNGEVKISKMRHTPKPCKFIKFNKKKGYWVRVLSPHERLNGGYQYKTTKNNSFSFGSIGNWRAQSGIVISNTAPYADEVQKRGYTVLENSVATRNYRTGNATKLVAMAINKQLKACGFNVKAR